MGMQVAPWSKTGGLGDVCGSLPPALAARGHRVMVVAPQYQNYPESSSTGVSAQHLCHENLSCMYVAQYVWGVGLAALHYVPRRAALHR